MQLFDKLDLKDLSAQLLPPGFDPTTNPRTTAEVPPLKSSQEATEKTVVKPSVSDWSQDNII